MTIIRTRRSSTHATLAAFAASFLLLLSSHAALAACGDAVVEGGEECDPGGGLFIAGNPANATCTTGSMCFFRASCCKFNCQFVGQGPACFDDNECTTNEICDQLGNCGGGVNAGAGSACDDGLFCTQNDTCNGSGTCVGTGDPCAGGDECASACDEALDACVFPNGTPCGDATDDDCNGWFDGPMEDADGDRHARASCGGDDCDDNDDDAYPGAPEICDRRDSDCSSGGGDATAEDADNDGYAPIGVSVCTGGPRAPTDCNDMRAMTFPGAPEYCNLQDDDCNGTVDDGTASSTCGYGYT